MRATLFALPMMLFAAAAFAGTNIGAVCYSDCEASTHSNPEYKACVARAADKADAALNQAYKTMQDKIRAAAKIMGQPAGTHLEDLKASQKYWINFRDANCSLKDNLAFGGTAIGGNYSSLSYQRIDDFERIQKDVIGEP
jgi:uncharacterized protein YecT (DUF1311 family)